MGVECEGECQGGEIRGIDSPATLPGRYSQLYFRCSGAFFSFNTTLLMTISKYITSQQIHCSTQKTATSYRRASQTASSFSSSSDQAHSSSSKVIPAERRFICFYFSFSFLTTSSRFECLDTLERERERERKHEQRNGTSIICTIITSTIGLQLFLVTLVCCCTIGVWWVGKVRGG